MESVTRKEPWQKTRDEVVLQAYREAENRYYAQKRPIPGGVAYQRVKEHALGTHYAAVEGRLARGKPVPAEVLADYPALVAKYAVQS